MLATNPAVIPRNHLVEDVIEAATFREDFDPFHQLVETVTKPYSADGIDDRFLTPPRPDQIVRQTFCGT